MMSIISIHLINRTLLLATPAALTDADDDYDAGGGGDDLGDGEDVSRDETLVDWNIEPTGNIDNTNLTIAFANDTNGTDTFDFVRSLNADVILALSMIIFYAIFVLFICYIIIKICIAILFTRSFKFDMPVEGLSADNCEQDTSSRTRGVSHSAYNHHHHHERHNHERQYLRPCQMEMTSVYIERTETPSCINYDFDETS